jgi:lysophospholipase L1-like esterase
MSLLLLLSSDTEAEVIPEIVEGAVVHFKSDSKVYSSGTTPAAVDGTIGVWGDNSVSGRDAIQATGIKQPLLKTVGSYNVVRFDGSDDCFRTASFDLPQPNTIYMVMKTSGADSTRFYDGNTVNAGFMNQAFGATRTRSIYAGSVACTVEGSSVPDVICTVINGASSLVESGFRDKVTGNPGAGHWSDGLLLGGAGGENAGFFATMDMYEYVVYPTAHTFAEREQMREYFAYHWLQKPHLQFVGDSLTVGTGAGAGEDYPTQLLDLLAGGSAAYTSNNIGVGGRTAATWAPLFLSDVGHYSTALGKVICPYWAGTNDIFAGASAATVYANLQTFWAGVRAQGIKVIATTIIARGNFDAGMEVIRLALNVLIRSDTSLYDGLCDVALLSQFDSPADTANTTYYNADTVHLVVGGYALVAAAMQPIVESVLNQTYMSLSS